MMDVITVEQAKSASGLRLGLVAGLPSAWSEAAKGIFHVKDISFAAVPYAGSADSADFEAWSGSASAPVAFYDGERPRAGWPEILLLAERLSPQPSLIPDDESERALMFGMSYEICGEMGFGWCARLIVIDGGLHDDHPLPREAAEYLAAKYDHYDGCSEVALQRVRAVLNWLNARLESQAGTGSPYLIGNVLSALDIYAATFAVMVAPWSPAQCPMPEFLRASFARTGELVADAVDERLLRHRDFIYKTHLVVPIEVVN